MELSKEIKDEAVRLFYEKSNAGMPAADAIGEVLEEVGLAIVQHAVSVMYENEANVTRGEGLGTQTGEPIGGAPNIPKFGNTED